MKAASLLLALLCFPVLLSPQQIFTPMTLPVPQGHPGAGMTMVSERDAGLIQVRLWEMGFEHAYQEMCSFGDPSLCKSLAAHVEIEQGSDSETIMLHAYYQDDDKQPAGFIQAVAETQCDKIKEFFTPRFPKWIKWERRVNAGKIEAIK